MKRFLSLALTLLLASAISAQNKIPVEPGVSKALAEFRSSHISNICYELDYRCSPADSSFHICIWFDWNPKGKEDLQIDFCFEDLRQCNAFINDYGNSHLLDYCNEHIIVPRKLLQKGENFIQFSFPLNESSLHNALNFRDDYLYTLNVPANARKLFPCFDQPDLKAAFDLKLTLPEDWKAVSAGSIEQTEKRPDNKDVEYYFETAENIPTYLFSFVAGKFEEYVDSRDGFEIRGLYRETDPEKVAQMPQIMDQVRHSIKWMEEYTGIPFPFPKLDFVIIPGYQFGGMEHIGAIQFNDKRIFLEKNPTQDQLLSRAELIAHEVSHMWFGDLVTMKWFDDVWTKEVFANYMASMIVAEQFPDINHNLNFIRNYHISALEEDRTDGSHPIAQRLDNLKDAGLLYGNIIYKKAPIVMRKLHQLMGDEPFRTGLQKYLRKFSYSNATWDDLIDILSDEAPEANLKAFSQSWVKERGCPTFLSDLSNGVLTVTQKDIQGTKAYRKLLSEITGVEQTERNIAWPQTIDNHILYNPHSLSWHILYDEKEVYVYIDKTSKTIELSSKYGPVRKYDLKDYYKYLFPNYDGRGFGRFCLSQEQLDDQISHYLSPSSGTSEEPRLSAMMNIFENVLMHNITADKAANVFVYEIKNWSEPLLASSAADYLSSLMNLCENQKDIQESLLAIRNLTGYSLAKQKALRILISKATEKEIVEKLYDIWKEQSEPLLNQTDYINLSYQLAIRYPGKWKEILDEQLSRIDNPDKRKEFEFVSRACNPDPKKQDELFAELLEPKNRKIEPWALSVLSLLNHPLREPESNRFIRPALDELLEVQQTGDIFFPKNWCTALLSGHKSPEARQILLDYLKEQLMHSTLPQPLLNKLLMAGYFLLNAE